MKSFSSFIIFSSFHKYVTLLSCESMFDFIPLYNPNIFSSICNFWN
nr:MAG TPA: hypothetical protein [Caudoviricetes sp.]